MQLFEYQQTGSQWLTARKSALLADEPGLGKSAQAIVAAESIGAKNVLILCPAIGRISWDREIRKFSSLTSSRQIHVAQTSKALLPPRSGAALTIICSYDLAARHDFRGLEFDLLILDEAHFLKSPKAKRTKAVMGGGGIVRRAKRVWALTGTPMPNHAGELWILLYTFGVTRLKYLEFVDRYCYVGDLGNITGTKKDKIPELKAMLGKIMLRRKKEDVLKDLPPLLYSELVVEAGKVKLDSAEKALVEKQLEKFMGLERHDGDDETFLRILEATAGSISTLRRYLGMQKVAPVVELVRQELESYPSQKVVLFAIHREVVMQLMAGLKDFGAVAITGTTPTFVREKSVREFQENPHCRVFIGNIQACGTSITLTASDQVLFVEQEWVPAANAQAAQRCHRIGQTRAVNARFVAIANSLDEKIAAVLRRKTDEISAVFD